MVEVDYESFIRGLINRTEQGKIQWEPYSCPGGSYKGFKSVTATTNEELLIIEIEIYVGDGDLQLPPVLRVYPGSLKMFEVLFTSSYPSESSWMEKLFEAIPDGNLKHRQRLLDTILSLI